MTTVTRTEYLPKLRTFCRTLIQTLSRNSWNTEQCKELMRVRVYAECVQCGTHVSGEELETLAQADSEQNKANIKVKRLWLGDCARRGCDCFYYQLFFEPLSELDWATILERTDQAMPYEIIPEESVNNPIPTVVRRKTLWPIELRPNWAWVALVAVICFLFGRQFYVGGQIPVFREPENFKVDIAMEDPL